MVKFWQTLRWPPRRLVLWHSIAAVPMATVVVLGAYLSYHYHQLSIENRDRVDRAYEVLDVVDGLYIAVQNADVAQRDFIITGEESHLSTFIGALKDESDDAARLRVLLAASATQEKNLTKLNEAVSAKLVELGRTIVVRKEQGFDAAQRAIRSADDGAAMNAIRQQVILLADNERKFLARRQAAGREHERDTLLVGIFIAALSVLTRICIALGIRHMHSRRQAAIVEEATPAANESEAPAGDAGAGASPGVSASRA
ncbi:MAG: CHASE3 domain-containing protein [Betaproteobacteria bacterium]